MIGRKVLAMMAGALLAVGFMAVPSTYGQVDERTAAKVKSPQDEQAGKAGSEGRAVATPRQKALLSDLSNAIRGVAASADDSVVHIEVKDDGDAGRTHVSRGGKGSQRNQDEDDSDEDMEQGPQGRGFGQLPPELRDQFRRFFSEQSPAPMPRRGLGSGIIYDDKGHILTNNHVVAGATQIKVLTTKGVELRAEVVGTDPLTDVAIIKVSKADGLQPARFGDSDHVDVGDLVLAMGNPFGLDFSVTLGIISAKGRGKNLQLGGIAYKDFLQTDAAINPGNSGGPLIDMDGQVIGMSTAIATQTGQYAGVGFAIPSNMARRIADLLIENGKITRGWLGVGIFDLTPAQRREWKLPEERAGVLVQDVTPDSPAEQAGFQAGGVTDIILEMNGKPMHSATELQMAVTLTPPGTKVNFRVWRYDEQKDEGKMVTLTVELGELPKDYLTRGGMGDDDEGSATPGSAKRYKSDELGISYATPTAESAKQYGWGKAPKGAIVTKVDPSGEAANLSVQPGDVIEYVNGAKIESAKDLRDALKTVTDEKRESFRMYVRSPGKMGGRNVIVFLE